jgi:hypothetical protein
VFGDELKGGGESSSLLWVCAHETWGTMVLYASLYSGCNGPSIITASVRKFSKKITFVFSHNRCSMHIRF